jgi:DNA-binding GntR family transcriptional regulator
LGRDRDPFERTIDALRHRLVEAGPLQGRPLAINALAVELDVSQTPVREALARLVGEGLVVRTALGRPPGRAL